jgi:hypothetical protein
VVKTGFCQRDFSKTNEQQRHLKKKLVSEKHEDEEVESIQTSKKILFFLPNRNKISSLTLGSDLPCLHAFCEHDVQSSTVARWTDLPLYIVNSRNWHGNFF